MRMVYTLGFPNGLLHVQSLQSLGFHQKLVGYFFVMEFFFLTQREKAAVEFLAVARQGSG